MTIACLRHFERRASNDVDIDVENPEHDSDGWSSEQTIVQIAHPEHAVHHRLGVDGTLASRPRDAPFAERGVCDGARRAGPVAADRFQGRRCAQRSDDLRRDRSARTDPARDDREPPRLDLTRRARGRRRLRRDEDAIARRGCVVTNAATAVAGGRDRRVACVSRVARQRQLHVSRLSRVRFQHRYDPSGRPTARWAFCATGIRRPSGCFPISRRSCRNFSSNRRCSRSRNREPARRYIDRRIPTTSRSNASIAPAK